MIFDFENTVKKHELDIKGIVQIGAHAGEEVELFDKYNTIYIEPQLEPYAKLYDKVKIRAFNELISDKSKVVEFHFATQSVCSSIYNTEKSREQGVQFIRSGLAGAISLKTFFKKYDLKPKDYNTLVIDTEGSELDILEGANLEYIDYIFVEFNTAYENTQENLNTYLNKKGFMEVDCATLPNEVRYGDLLFIKMKNV